MEQLERVKRHSVIVSQGSGALIQPSTTEYTYVFTAKHNILVDSEDPTSGKKPVNSINVIDIYDVEHEVLEAFISNDQDIAVLIIPYVAGLSIFRFHGALEHRDEIRLSGFPENKRSQSAATIDQYGYYDLIVRGGNSPIVEFGNHEFAEQSNIVGFSGGGLYYLDRDRAREYLVGIETSMAGNPQSEQHGRVAGVSLESFKCVIEANTFQTQPLASLSPIHLSGFDHIFDSAFQLDAWINPNQLKLVTDCLRSIAIDNLSDSSITPRVILEEFHEHFQMNEQDEGFLEDQVMWIAFLELLVISYLIDNPTNIDIDYIRKVIESRRLAYIAENKTWKRLLAKIVSSEYKNLKKNGVIVVKTLTKSGVPLMEQGELKGAISNIYQLGQPNENGINIANASKNVLKGFSLVDLAALHDECIDREEAKYNSLGISDHDQIRNLISEDYEKYLGILR